MTVEPPPAQVPAQHKGARFLGAATVLMAVVIAPVPPTLGLLLWTAATVMAVRAATGSATLRPAVVVIAGYPVLLGTLGLSVTVGALPTQFEVAAVVIVIAAIQSVAAAFAARRFRPRDTVLKPPGLAATQPR